MDEWRMNKRRTKNEWRMNEKKWRMNDGYYLVPIFHHKKSRKTQELSLFMNETQNWTPEIQTSEIQTAELNLISGNPNSGNY